MLKIYGHSDDVVCIEMDGAWHDEVSNGRVITIGDSTRGVRVTFKYAASKKSGAVWRGSVEQLDEGIPMFPVTVTEAEPAGAPDPKSYSVVINVDCPLTTPVVVGKRNLNTEEQS